MPGSALRSASEAEFKSTFSVDVFLESAVLSFDIESDVADFAAVDFLDFAGAACAKLKDASSNSATNNCASLFMVGPPGGRRILPQRFRCENRMKARQASWRKFSRVPRDAW